MSALGLLQISEFQHTIVVAKIIHENDIIVISVKNVKKEKKKKKKQCYQ